MELTPESGIRFKNLGTKKEVEICLQIQLNTLKNNRLNEIKMTSCPVWLP